jgi:hypothetical protein
MACYFGQVTDPMPDGGWQPAGGVAGCLENEESYLRFLSIMVQEKYEELARRI